MKSAVFTYKLLLKKEEKKVLSENLEINCEQERLRCDVSVICQMLDDGYTLMDILECLQKHSYAAAHAKDKKKLALYIDKVLSNINKKQLQSDYQAAEASYLAKYKLLSAKYENYLKETFSEFHEGIIVLEMLIKEKFHPEIIKEVLEKNSISRQLNEDYVNNIIEACGKVQRLYYKIHTFKEVELHSEGDIYRYYAKKYMRDTDTEILNARDEVQIFIQIYEKLSSQSKQNMICSERVDFNTKMKSFFIKALKEASPVAVEPGRNKSLYITTILGEVELVYEAKNASHTKYTITENMYSEILDKFRKKNFERENQVVSDGSIAKELLSDHHKEQYIIRAIAENSITVPETDQPFTYAKEVVEAAKASLAAEREIFYFDIKKLPKTESYIDLCKEGLTAKDLYLQAMKERLIEYPSFIRKMGHEFADEDAVEKLLHQYPDFDQQALKDVIQERSPRACLMKNPVDYVNKLFSRVKDRLKQSQKQLENNLKVQKEFNKLRGLASEGIHFDHVLDKYKDGKVALKMLQNNVSQEDIRRVLISMAKTVDMADPLIYANEIINQAMIVDDRINVIKKYEPPSDQAKKPKDLYMEELQKRYKKKNFIQADMEVESIKNMILKNCSTDEISHVIKKYSPVAVEPGRGEHYVDYVKKLAQKSIEQEEKRLKMYRAIPRLNCEESAIEEYKYHRDELKKQVHLPYREIMDTLIVATMMIQGYKEKAIKEALLKESPFNTAHDNAYARNIIKNAAEYIKGKNQQETVMVRTLTTTTTN